jgi:hypothetical protein
MKLARKKAGPWVGWAFGLAAGVPLLVFLHYYEPWPAVRQFVIQLSDATLIAIVLVALGVKLAKVRKGQVGSMKKAAAPERSRFSAGRRKIRD